MECPFPTRGFACGPVLLVYAAPGGRVEVVDAGGVPVAGIDGAPGRRR